MDRRLFCAGLLAAGASPAIAQSPRKRAFTTGPLAKNRAALSFEPVPDGFYLPDITVIGEAGPARLSDFKGKPRLLTLWAEWCAPCLVEAGELAVLQARFGGPDFEVTSVLTRSDKKLDVAGARKVLSKVKADTLPLWVEPKGGNAVLRALSPERRSLPCLLVVDKSGRVRGRSHGAISIVTLPPGVKPGPDGRLSPEDEAKMQAEKEKAGNGTVWSTPHGEAFVKALIEGALDA
ncbi:MAG: TlpA disulfide reductase family protein [Asticcacaulis sp.]